MSDTNVYDWSVFSHDNDQGVNSRLAGIISEFNRCAHETKKAGGDTCYHGGDVFHQRGLVKPEVFNPLRDCLRSHESIGIRWIGIAGNHDLSSRDSSALHSSVAMLNTVPNVDFFHKPGVIRPDNVVLFPWVEGGARYLESIRDWVKENGDVSGLDLICHIGIDGTLTGMPGHGVSHTVMKELGFKRVFSGHYHHHRDFGNGVFSIGASTQQSWRDVGTKAGFMIVSEDDVKFFASHQPSFVNINKMEIKEEDLFAVVDGNYVQAKIEVASNKDVAAARRLLSDNGAKGISIIAMPKDTAAKREKASVSSGETLDKSVESYCKKNGFEDVIGDCNRILGEVE